MAARVRRRAGSRIPFAAGARIDLVDFHVEDPVPFQRAIRVTIEHGHANRRSDDYASVAYWYQAEPHRPFGILPMAERLPRPL